MKLIYFNAANSFASYFSKSKEWVAHGQGVHILLVSLIEPAASHLSGVTLQISNQTVSLVAPLVIRGFPTDINKAMVKARAQVQVFS